jgi:hypothetical protein
MPGGIRLFLVYAFLILAGIGISLRSVVDLAISVPVSFEGLVVMALLAPRSSRPRWSSSASRRPGRSRSVSPA